LQEVFFCDNITKAHQDCLYAVILKTYVLISIKSRVLSCIYLAEGLSNSLVLKFYEQSDVKFLVSATNLTK